MLCELGDSILHIQIKWAQSCETISAFRADDMLSSFLTKEPTKCEFKSKW